LKTYKTVQKKVIDKTYCDVCGSCCTDDDDTTECAILEALWGYASKQDGSEYEIHLCEKCFDETIQWMKKKRRFYLGCFNYPHDEDPFNGKSELISMTDLDIVTTYIKDAEKYELVPEVVCFALQYMKNHPEKTIEDAISYGYWEWCK